MKLTSLFLVIAALGCVTVGSFMTTEVHAVGIKVGKKG
jgi:hypothetical protein